MLKLEIASACDKDLVACFAAGRDEGAFAEIVRRHGPMVMGVAKRIVRNQHDAEDAFQATFLALASRAEGVRRRAAIAGWLHRTAVRAARAVGRRDQRWQQKVRRKAEQMDSLGKSLRHEKLKDTIDEELEKLPSKCRTAVVLCDLEGRTRKEAAGRLGIPIRTVSSQVAKGRELLKGRLVRRGITLSAGGLAAHLDGLAEASGSLTSTQVAQTASMATLYAAGKSAAEIGVSQAVITLARGVGTMTIAKFVYISTLSLALAVSVGPVSKVMFPTARAGTIVSPSEYENAEAPSNSGVWPLSSRAQVIYDATEFAALPSGGAFITEINFRPDGRSPVGQQFGFGRLRVSLSVTKVAPLGISSTFASNITGTPVAVYDGPWSATAVNADPPGPATRPFDYRIQLQNPYFYDPSQGNLLWDMIFESPASPQGATDLSPGPSPREGHIWTGTLGANSPVSTTERFATVNQFVFVPEPP
jgi:RNA polymerase sigma factor (sigma-70 family)